MEKEKSGAEKEQEQANGEHDIVSLFHTYMYIFFIFYRFL